MKRLMIGDFVRAITNKGTKIVQVDNIDTDGWIIFKGGATYHFEPIEIDEDFLVDLGFTDRKLIGDTERYILKDDTGKPIITMDNYGDHYECNFKVGSNVGKINLIYVHQFQHLCTLLEVTLTPYCYGE